MARSGALGRISLSSIMKQKWTDSFVFLMGCEAAALDNVQEDIAEAFLRSGARCVVGSLTRLPSYVAESFFKNLCSAYLLALLPTTHFSLPGERRFFLRRCARPWTERLKDAGRLYP